MIIYYIMFLPCRMLKRYPNYPLTTKLISKRFYCENVFDDTTSDIPKSRWRFRNNFVESAAHPQQRTENHESYDHDAKTGPERKPVPVSIFVCLSYVWFPFCSYRGLCYVVANTFVHFPNLSIRAEQNHPKTDQNRQTGRTRIKRTLFGSIFGFV